jgi:hypothetical protein
MGIKVFGDKEFWFWTEEDVKNILVPEVRKAAERAGVEIYPTVDGQIIKLEYVDIVAKDYAIIVETDSEKFCTNSKEKAAILALTHEVRMRLEYA